MKPNANRSTFWSGSTPQDTMTLLSQALRSSSRLQWRFRLSDILTPLQTNVVNPTHPLDLVTPSHQPD